MFNFIFRFYSVYGGGMMRCAICNKPIADCDPPLCERVECEKLFRIECSYNTWAREQTNRELSNQEMEGQVE